MRILNKASILVCMLALAACGKTDPAADAANAVTAVPAPAAVSDVAPEPPTPTTGIWFEPANLSACGSGKDVVKVHWDVSSVAGVTSVQIVPIEKGAPAGVFGVAGAKGSKDTGPWMHSGGTMAVVNAVNGEELARASVGSIPCAK